MVKQYSLLTAILIALLLAVTSCGNDTEVTRTPGGTSVGGANITTGLEIDEDYVVTEPQTSFEPNQEFYFYFHNNLPFGSEEVTVQLIDNSDDQVLAENSYDVDPDAAELTDKIWFGSTGMFTIAAKVDGELRATREVLIEE